MRICKFARMLFFIHLKKRTFKLEKKKLIDIVLKEMEGKKRVYAF